MGRSTVQEKPREKKPRIEFERILNEIMLDSEKAFNKAEFMAALWDKYKDTPKYNNWHVVNYAKKLIREKGN